MVSMPRSATAGRPDAEQHRRDVGDDLVDETGPHEGSGQRRAAFQEDVLPVAGEELLEHGSGITRAQVQALALPVEDPARRLEVTLPHHHPERLVRDRLVTIVASGELRVVHLDGVGADQHHVAQGAQAVGVDPGRLAGDPARGAVGSGAATVERGGELPGDERASVLDREGPHSVEGTRLIGEQPRLDVDP